MSDPARRDVRPSDWEPGVRARLVAREESALGEVYDQFSSFVYGIAFRVIGDARAAEDVVQDVFLKLWESPGGFDPARGSLRTWLGHARPPAGGRPRAAGGGEAADGAS